ncbi:hypothetical protein NM96_06725 [Neisseria mucosa]|nr:hypothetical protein NM96_06725 [Neisseria mucosa]
MPGCVITLPKTVSPKTVSERLDLSFGIFARRGEKYSCYSNTPLIPLGYLINRASYRLLGSNRHT